MRVAALVQTLLFAAATARSPRPGRKSASAYHSERRAERSVPADAFHQSRGRDSTSKPIITQTEWTSKFAVNGSAIPEVDFDIGESYAGLLPISDDKDASELFFWFFPTENSRADDEILIWLNGGPGCSSLEGLLQENGPFLWQYGTYRPVQNPWTWVNLTNVVWVEQPAGTGFSQQNGVPPATNENEVAEQFLGFFKKFVDTFGLHGRKIYITGESYAGFYVPYIADAMHNATDKKYYNIDSIMFYDPVLTYDVVQTDIPATAFANQWSHLLGLNKTFLADLNRRSAQCGFDAFLETAMTYPPKGPLPTPPNVQEANPYCYLQNLVIDAATLSNPCFDIYQIATTCPVLWDVLGFPGSFPYVPAGAQIYFNRSDVQKAINAPPTDWSECSSDVLNVDTSTPAALSILPRVIEKNRRTIIGHAALDFVLLLNGTLMAVQNMTWHGRQGFSTPPSEWHPLYVPALANVPLSTLAGAGELGSWHTERGLTVTTVDLSGHMIPQYAPSVAYRQLEFLLGRISDLSQRGPFTH